MLLLVAAPLMQVQAPPPEVPFEKRLEAAEAREILEVPPGQKQISEKSLPKDTLRSDRDVPPKGRRDGPIGDLELQGQRGMRLLGFVLQPGEKVLFRLNVLDPKKMQISLATPARPDALSEEIARVNRAPAGLRAKGVEIRNTTGEPYGLVVRISGFVGQPYALAIERVP
ncbi:MAG: hypothetical protein HY823_15635 [Acidobacteria bacterium]|nr:hypothetical protein [Acidobacteriota bacterium]